MKTQTAPIQKPNEATRLRDSTKDAQAKWGKITKEEFTEMDGSSSKLTKLVESRYDLKHEDAKKQVQAFIDVH